MKYQSIHAPIITNGPIHVTTIPCPECSSTVTLTVSDLEFEAAVNGALLQKAFPSMPSGERERLISGYCDDCWYKLFAEYGYE